MVTEELIKALPHLAGLVEVSREEYCSMVADLINTDGKCTVHTSPDGDLEKIFSVPINIWTLRYPEWADTRVGYQTVAAVVTRYGLNPIHKYFVHPSLIEMLIIF